MTVWTKEEKQRLTQYRALGMSWERIQKVMGKTPGQLENMAKRLGLNERKEKNSQCSITVRPPLTDPTVITLDQLKPRQCRYPTHDTSPYGFCGQPQFQDTNYCLSHYKLCTQEGTRKWKV